ncbi:MAG: tetratricopeptide repeat protein [Candidatus Omnitrophica bacterium]|nr:tetratricopeptide repeat protein [Candidatus Omnitrophota bacterium]
MKKIHNDFLIVLGLAALGILLYAGIFHSPFQFDDWAQIPENITTFQLPDLAAVWRFSHKPLFLTLLSFALNYYFHGLDTLGYHLVNVILHVMNAILIYFFCHITFRSPALASHPLQKESKTLAVFAAFLFLAHPLQTAAVSYISQRSTELAAFFYLGTLLCYALFRSNRNRIFYAISLVFCMGAMFSKEIAFSLPLTLFLYERMFWTAPEKEHSMRMFRLVPFFLTLFIIPMLYLNMSNLYSKTTSGFFLEGFLPREARALSRTSYLLTEINVMRTYVRLLFFPVGQNLDYDYPIAHTFWSWATAGSAILLAGWLAFAVRVRRSLPFVAFGIFWFFLTLSVESTFIPLRDVIFEHRLYLPMAGFALLLADFLGRIFKTPRKRNIGFIFIIFLLSLLTWQRNQVWASDITLWQDVIRKSPHKGRGYNSLAASLFTHGRYDEAIHYAREAIIREPDNPLHYINLALNKGMIGDRNAEIKILRQAVSLHPPDRSKYFHRIGKAYIQKGNLDKAIAYFEKAASRNSRYTAIYYDLGQAYEQKRNWDKAFECYQYILLINPACAEAYNALGLIDGKRGNVDQAIEYFKKGLRANPRSGEIYNNLGTAYHVKNGDLNTMIYYYEKAVRLAPSFKPAYANLARAYAQKGDEDKARFYREKALRLDSR